MKRNKRKDAKCSWCSKNAKWVESGYSHKHKTACEDHKGDLTKYESRFDGELSEADYLTWMRL